MSAEPTAAMVTRADLTLTADPSRVVAQLFVPGQELALDHESRTSNVLGRILSLPEETVVATLESVIADFSGRHRDLRQILPDALRPGRPPGARLPPCSPRRDGC